MRNTLALIAVALFTCLSVFESPAAVGTVATANLSSGGGIHAIINQDLRVNLRYTGPTNATPTNTIFGQFTFHTNDVGSTFSIDAFSDPGFLPFLLRATNGILNTVAESFFVGGNLSGAEVPETSFFTTFPYGGNNGIDLGGFQIQRIDLTLNSLTFASPGSNPVGDGIWTDYSWNITLSFIGVVPEPSTAAILGCGLLVLVFRRRQKTQTEGPSSL